MIRFSAVLVFLALFLSASTCPAAEDSAAPQTPLSQGAVQTKKFPRIVIYSVAWCPHCKEAKEYLTKNNIPFINRDVELDSVAMEELTQKYKSTGVPVIVFGNDDKVLRGFNRDQFEKALKELSR
jgi:glutaredoxin-like YruB-family protein